MKFKTFNSDIDKISSKWGMFGRSFNDIGTAIIGKINDINRAFQATNGDLIGSIKDSDSIWKRLYPSKESIKSHIIDIDALFPKQDDSYFSSKLTKLVAFNQKVSDGSKKWQDYFKNLSDGEKWQIEFVQNTDLQKASLSDVKKAYDSARTSALAHNEAIKAQTFSAKAGKVALQALATVGNMLAMWAITKGLELAVKGIDNLVHSAEHCKERADELMSSYQSALDKANSNAKTVEDLAARYVELSKDVNNLGETYGLTAEETKEYHDICNKIADMFPTLVQGYTNEGNAILSLKGNVEQLRDAYKEAQQEAYNMLIVSGKDSDGNDIIKNFQNVISNNNPFIKLDSSANEYLEIIKILHKAMLTSEEDYDKMYNAMLGGGNKLTIDYNMSQAQLNKVKKTLKDIGFQADLTDEDKRSINASVKAYIQTYQAEIDLVLCTTQI
ncbi:MAG: hypothetical protein NC543_13695 [bacterium]|nr:hypothetical protein [bacterium]